MARTSVTHPLQVDAFPLGMGYVGMTLCPGRKGPSLNGPDWDRDLGLDLHMILAWGASLVISLTERDEMQRLGVSDLDDAVPKAGMEWLHLPIPDTGIPDVTWIDCWERSSTRIHQLLDDGHRIVIHCKAGLERTALVATLLQCDYGVDMASALATVARTRAGAGPLPHQHRWLERNRRDAIGQPARVADQRDR